MKKLACLLLVLCLLTVQMPVMAAKYEPVVMIENELDMTHTIDSVGRYTNWAGVSTVSQFSDEKGNYCFAVDEGDRIAVVKTRYGAVTQTIYINKLYELFGAIDCDHNGNLFLVWGRNGSTDPNFQTIFVTKHSPDGKLLATVGGNGSEGLDYYYSESFYTKYPFDAGNCDVAIQGNTLVGHYARTMYGTHQSNTVFVVKIDTMEVFTGFSYYNSHSFDQRVTPYQKSGGFLLASHGDCYPRAFTTSLTGFSRVQNEMDTFNFWVQEGAFDRYDMYQVNRTYARLGNVLETKMGAALIGSSARSLSEAAISEPYDVFVQVFDPMGNASDPASYVTTGQRKGIAGRNGDEKVTDYGVSWLTDLAGTGLTADVVQAVSVPGGQMVVLYELCKMNTYNKTYVSTQYMLLDNDGTLVRGPLDLNGVRLNVDEDPVYAQGAVQWTANVNQNSKEMRVYSLFPMAMPESREELENWRREMFRVTGTSVTAADGVLTARATVCSDGSAGNTVYCAFYNEQGKMVDIQGENLPETTKNTMKFSSRARGAVKARFFVLNGAKAMCPTEMVSGG